MSDVYICDAIRTPIGRYGGALSTVRADDLAAIPLKALMSRNPNVDWSKVDDVILGCANQAGEDNRNVARMSTLLAGLPETVSAVTVNRLCGSGLNAVGDAARAIKTGEAQLMIAGGVESMSRAPLVMGKAETAFGRTQELFDTTMGWRFINKKLDSQYGTETMPQTAENLAAEFNISREDQDKFALASQTRAGIAQLEALTEEEIVPVSVAQRKGGAIVFSKDEHLRGSSLEKLAKLKPIFPDGTVTAGNASGINDGAAAILLTSKQAAEENSLIPRARVLGMATAGTSPRIMGIGPVYATQKLLKQLNMKLDDFDLLEINEAFSAQVLACTRTLGLDDTDPRINPLGGAIAYGHPLGMSGARLVTTAINQMHRNGSRFALCTMCVGVGQGIALALEIV